MQGRYKQMRLKSFRWYEGTDKRRDDDGAFVGMLIRYYVRFQILP